MKTMKILATVGFVACLVFAIAKLKITSMVDDTVETTAEEVVYEPKAGIQEMTTEIAMEIAAEPMTEVVEIYYDVPLSDEVQDRIIELCKEADIDPRMVFAIIHHESRFDPSVVSKTNDYGLMQINRGNHGWLSKELGITNLLDPIQNVEAGIYILSLLVPKYDNIHKVLMCYAAGENGAKKKFNRGIYETNFSRTIIADMENYKLR